MLNAPLLRRSPAFRAIWLARTISFFGDTVATTALLWYIYGTYGTGTTVSFVLLAQALPRVFGPLAGSLADRVDQRRLLLWCDMGQAIVWTSIAVLLPPLPLLLALVFCTSILATIFTPAGRSALPVLARASDLPAANALLSVGINAGLALGPVLGGVVFALLGVRGALFVNTLSFVLSALLLSRLPPLPPVPSVDAVRPSLFATTHSGLMYLRQHATARTMALGLFLVVLFAALDDIAITALTNDVFGTGALGLGVIRSVYGVGMVLGPLALLGWSKKRDPALVLLVGTALLGIGGLLTGFAPTFVVAVLAQSVGGIGNGFENIGNDTLIQRTVPRAMLGRVFGTVYSGASLASLLAYVLGGPLLDWTSPRTVFMIAGSGVLASLVVLCLLLPRGTGTQHPEVDDVKRSAHIPHS